MQACRANSRGACWAYAPSSYIRATRSTWQALDGSVKMNTLDLPVLLQLRFLGFLAIQVGPTFNLMTDVGGSTQDTKWRIDRPTMGYAAGVDVRLWKLNVTARYNGSFKKSEVLGITTGENRISTFQLGLGFFF